jgi:hypothetical protein
LLLKEGKGALISSIVDVCLPDPPEKYFAGKGTGQRCDVCEQVIAAEKLEYELDSGGRTLRFHDNCLDMWRQARS